MRSGRDSGSGAPFEVSSPGGSLTKAGWLPHYVMNPYHRAMHFSLPGDPVRKSWSRAFFVAATVLVLLVGCDRSQGKPSEPVDLESEERSVFSQFGEDGVIEKIFEVIEPGPKFAVEFGAHDGVNNSNMRNLVLNHGWDSFQIEGNPNRARELEENYEDYPGTKTLEAWVWPGNIEILFEENGVPKDLDLLVIDIDSNDYYVWRAIHDFRPKVVMIEGNYFFPPPERVVIDYHPMNYWDGTYYVGASLQSLTDLANKKGYELLYQMSEGPNVFFVDKQYFDRFGIEDNSTEAIYRTKGPLVMDRESVSWGRNGVPWPEGKDKLTWDKLEIEKKFIRDR
jgi:hypothetical protein